MQTRREQVRAYRFVNRRVVSAMLSGEPETNDLPMRRLSLGTFASAMIAALVFAGVGVYGLMFAGGGRPDSGSLIIERETGARYVYLNDGRLHPVLNYASARLILGSQGRTRMMSANSLRGLPRGRTLGIPGAPDSLPDRHRMLGLPWSLCSTPRSDDVPVPVTQLLLGPPPRGGGDVGDSALLVAVPRGSSWLMLPSPKGDLEAMRANDPAALAMLGYSAQPIPVGEALVNGVTRGPNLNVIRISGAGTPSGQTVNGAPAPLGQLYQLEDHYFLTTSGGLFPVGDVTRRLLLGPGSQPIPISGQDASKIRRDTHWERDGWPEVVSPLFEAPSANPTVCATYRNGDAGDGETTLRVYERTPAALELTDGPDATEISLGVRTADRVVVDGGHGALVRSLPTPGATAKGTTVYLVTDQGRKFPLAGNDAAAALGYAGVHPVPVPAALLALIPSGPTLDQSDALRVDDRATPGTQNPPADTGSSPGKTPTRSPSTRSTPRPSTSRTSSAKPTATRVVKPSTTASASRTG